MPGTHHIALISALAAVTSANPVMGTVFGILASLFGDFVGKTFNSHCDSHIVRLHLQFLFLHLLLICCLEQASSVFNQYVGFPLSYPDGNRRFPDSQ